MSASTEIVVVKTWSRCGFWMVKRGELTVLNVVRAQEWRGFCGFWMQKNVGASKMHQEWGS
jgi:hypothetical protein